MNVDEFNRIESEKESFYSYHGSREVHKNCCNLKAHQRKQVPTINCIRECQYDVRNDNEGFGKWLACQIGIQMTCGEHYKKIKEQRDYIEDIANNTKKGYVDNFKIFFEEKIWKLAQF